MSRGIGEYQLPDLVVNPASRIIFGSVSRVRVSRADLLYQSAFHAITIMRYEQVKYGDSSRFVRKKFDDGKLDLLELDVCDISSYRFRYDFIYLIFLYLEVR